MDDIEKSKLALEQLEAAYAAKVEAKIAAGELRVVGRAETSEDTVVVGSEEEVAGAVERAKAAALEKYGNVPPLHFDFLVIVTGVPRAGERYSPDAVPSCPRLSEEAPPKEESVEEPAEFVPVYCAPDAPKQYLYVTVRQATDATPGHIVDGFYEVTNGELVLTGTDGQLISSRRLKEGQEPLDVAREMLRKTVNVD